MDPKLAYEYHQFMQQVGSCKNITEEYLSSLGLLVFQSYQQNRFSEPMPWIGVYIALASLFCILAMVADLLHGLKNRQLWFPCKCFTMNAASLTVIAVAMKLPVDLNNQMPGYVDQAAKLGSMGFMCTIMANLLPSLATMDKKELVSNIIAVGILVITFVVNVCIQITTGLLSFHGDEAAEAFGQVLSGIFPAGVYLTAHRFIPAIYVSVLLMLLIIYACSSLAILKSKQILESKYQSAHETILKDQELLQQPGRLLTVEKLTQHVSNYWVMAGTGSPQFMTVCSATTSASGVICAFTTVLHILIMISVTGSLKDFQSDYKWSMLVILVIQFMGTILGTIAPLCRCFAVLSFKLSVKWIWNHIKVSTVETYWTEKLSDWKQNSIPFPWGSRKCKIVIENVKILILNVCIGFQKTVVVTCKMIAVIPLLFVICVLSCFRCWKWLKAMFFSAPSIVLVKNPEQLDKDKDLSRCVLQLQDDMEFPERTLKGILKSVNRLIQKAEKQQPNNLMNLLKESRGFEGVEKFDSHLVPPLLSKEYLTSWSLTLVSLTTIAISLPNIQNNIVDCLLSSVSEGLVYVTLVEETLNTTNDHVTIQKAAKTLWLEVEVYHKWLGNKLTKPEPQANTVGQILRWLRDTAKNIVTDLETIDIGSRNNNDKSICRFISANSMYRIIETTMLSYNDDVDLVTQEELFAQLLSMIADILAACLINLPQVIAVKCHASTIEKRETSVHVAAQLLGETMQIINTLKDRQLPSLNLDELAYIEKWCAYFTPPFP
ncbi:uncharacterized protein LOC111903923 [Lactuca sativa]|uniref:uncharacterized protein LOC111903923 n=1 Tax=Lactuca sativa TaxID=4236 RepID=UPI000CD8A633|nr:uncharacterized protein LOC111903923 [Lactuca sativa]